jgi:alkylation response protein AidB-like acyl-CoA dehydrogenase
VDYSFSAEALRFGDEVRQWLRRELEPGWSLTYAPSTPEWIEFQAEWDRKLYRAGWGAIFWPKEYGGLDATPEQRVIFAKVLAEHDAPDGLGKLGKRLLAPVLLNHGTPEQKERFLPPILRGETFWAQGFSEPTSGSDLASLRTRGHVDGDELVVNGHKIWTSHAWYCDAVFALVRTSTEERRQQGISFVLIPTDTPGVRIEKIHQINRKTEFSECFFEDARVPLDNVVGPLGQGWTIAKSLLQYERGAEMAFGRSAEIREAVRSLLVHLGAAARLDDPAVLQTLGRLQADYLAAELNALRLLGGQVAGKEPGHLSAVVKLQQSEDWRSGTMEHLRLLGPAAFDTGWEHFVRYLNSRSATIASGSSEVQREIIAHRVLGLPR